MNNDRSGINFSTYELINEWHRLYNEVHIINNTKYKLSVYKHIFEDIILIVIHDEEIIYTLKYGRNYTIKNIVIEAKYTEDISKEKGCITHENIKIDFKLINNNTDSIKIYIEK